MTRNFKRCLIVGASIALLVTSAQADRIVNAPGAFTHTLLVRPVQVSKTTGEAATVFGDASSEWYIKRLVNRVMAQAGIRVDWLPLEPYTNDFAYDGSPSDYYAEGSTRPESHMDGILSAASPFTADSTITPLFFVEIPPYFGQRSEYSVNGYAKFGSIGIALHVGEMLVLSNPGRDIIASVICHELGHNLGLGHVTGPANLMTSGGSTDQLTPAQTAAIGGSPLLRPVPSPTNYSLWAFDRFLSDSPFDDSDGDKLTTLEEFLFLTDPLVPSSNPVSAPQLIDDALVWSLDINPAAASDGIICLIEVSSDLDEWLPAGTSGTSSTVVTNTANELSIRLDTDVQKGFMRYRAIMPD